MTPSDKVDLGQTRRKLKRLRGLLRDHRSMLIVLQDFPDPDAVGAAQALRVVVRALGDVTSSIAYGGIVGRVENRSLVKYLEMNLLRMDEVDLQQFALIGMVDTQPGEGNNSLDKSVVPDVVIDHHPMHSATRQSPYYDIRKRYGSTATILYEYLLAADIEPSMPLATALLYGIRSDTNDMGREACQADLNALLKLYAQANVRMLGRIEMEREPPEYYATLSVALTNARTYGPCVVTNLGDIDNPDMIGEIADLMLRHEGSSVALSYGFFQHTCLLSVRVANRDLDAGRIAHRLVGRNGTGGGHRTMAGGQVSMKSITARRKAQLGRTLVRRLLRVMNLNTDARGQALVPAG